MPHNKDEVAVDDYSDEHDRCPNFHTILGPDKEVPYCSDTIIEHVNADHHDVRDQENRSHLNNESVSRSKKI